MEVAVTPEWSCLELKHCCNQYRLSWGWRARTFRSLFVEIMEKTVCYFSQTCRKQADMAGALQVMMLAQGNKYKEEHFIMKQTAELCLKLLGTHRSQRCWGCIWPTHPEKGYWMFFVHSCQGDTDRNTIVSQGPCKVISSPINWVRFSYYFFSRNLKLASLKYACCTHTICDS